MSESNPPPPEPDPFDPAPPPPASPPPSEPDAFDTAPPPPMSTSSVPEPGSGPASYDTAPPAAPAPPLDAGAYAKPAPPAQPLPYEGALGYPGPYIGPPPDPNVRTMGMLCHLLALSGLVIPGVGNWGGPLLIWLLKKQEHPFIDDQGKESLNFQLTMLIVAILLTPTLCIAIGFFLLPAVALLSIIFAIIGGVKANAGEAYRYPMTFRFIK